jgi:hypothetical protein
LWVIRAHAGNDWSTEVVPGLQRFFLISRQAGAIEPDAVSVTAVDRNGNESAAVMVTLVPAR